MVRMSATGSPPNANSRITIGRRQREPSRTERDIIMKLVIIGGTGLIGSKLVTQLKEHGHEAVPASPDTGGDTLTGKGLPEVLQGGSVVVDVSNAASLAEA